jgi:hypothetical protein
MRLSVIVWLLTGCAASPQPKHEELSEGALMRETMRDQTAGAPSASPSTSIDSPKEAAIALPAIGASSHGTVRRAELVEVLDAHPGTFLRHVQTEPRLSGGRFAGWRLTAFYPGDPRFAGVDLQAGDVIVRVNGRSIERPDQLMVVWDGLRQASELVVELERDGRPRTLRWTIVDP